MKSFKKDKTFSQDLSAGALSYTTDLPSKPFELDQILVKATETISETITITLDSASGASYDTILGEVVLVAERDYIFRPQGKAKFQSGDQIKVQCTNTGGSGTVNGIVKTSEI